MVSALLTHVMLWISRVFFCNSVFSEGRGKVFSSLTFYIFVDFKENMVKLCTIIHRQVEYLRFNPVQVSKKSLKILTRSLRSLDLRFWLLVMF